MSIRLDLADLATTVETVGPTCFLLTTNDDHSPHPVNVRASFDGTTFRVSAGRRTTANGRDRSTVTLLWPASEAHPAESPDPMNLIVDCSAHAEGDGLVLTPTSAMWHRTPDQPHC